MLARKDLEGEMRVYVLHVTRYQTDKDTEAVAIPATVRQRLGLDEERSWIVVTEANVFAWPGPDLRFVPGKGCRAPPTASCHQGCSKSYAIGSSSVPGVARPGFVPRTEA